MKKIEKIGMFIVPSSTDEFIVDILAKIAEKTDEIIDRLNEQPEENIEKVYVDPIKVDFTREDISIPVEYKTREEVEKSLEDTPEEWEEGITDVVLKWRDSGKQIDELIRNLARREEQLLEEKGREAREEGYEEGFDDGLQDVKKIEREK